jgi:hypothetical protein
LGIGDWGLGLGPNPQYPIPNTPFIFPIFYFYIFITEFIVKYSANSLVG